MINSYSRHTNDSGRLHFPAISIIFFLLVISFISLKNVYSQDSTLPDRKAVPTTLYMPIVSKQPVVIKATTLNRAGQFGETYRYDLTWQTANLDGGETYTIMESQSPSMSPLTNVYTSTEKAFRVNLSASTNNIYYYTVQSNTPNSQPSAVRRVVGPYKDDFSTNSGWDIRRQDFDDTENVMSYTGDYMKMHVRGRWDYFVTSPLAEAPSPPYRIRTRVKLEGPGNLNTYGIIFGGDYHGGACPTIFPPAGTPAPDVIGTSEEWDVLPTTVRSSEPPNYVYDNCLNQYYRVMFLWKDGFTHMHTLIKQINFHDDNNSGRGDAISGTLELPVSSGSANDWNDWAIEVYPNGQMMIYSGANLVYNTHTNGDLIHQPYFGLWASTDEYPGSDPLWDFIIVEPITQ